MWARMLAVVHSLSRGACPPPTPPPPHPSTLGLSASPPLEHGRGLRAPACFVRLYVHMAVCMYGDRGAVLGRLQGFLPALQAANADLDAALRAAPDPTALQIDCVAVPVSTAAEGGASAGPGGRAGALAMDSPACVPT